MPLGLAGLGWPTYTLGKVTLGFGRRILGVYIDMEVHKTLLLERDSFPLLCEFRFFFFDRFGLAEQCKKSSAVNL